MNRNEHMAFCKQRALEFVDAGDLNNAVASMTSDLGKHPETARSVQPPIMVMGMTFAAEGDAAAVRRWIEDFA